MPAVDPDTEQLLDRAAAGDEPARQLLFERCRTRLRRMVALRLDRRLAARVDPSDVVQEALADADRKIDGYLRDRPLPFYPWLRQIAWERLVKIRRLHTAGRRDVGRERAGDWTDESALALAERLAASSLRPDQRLLRKELLERVRRALERLSAPDREILMLRHAEQLSTRETAAVLGVSESSAKSRHLRALDRLRIALDGYSLEGSS